MHQNRSLPSRTLCGRFVATLLAGVVLVSLMVPVHAGVIIPDWQPSVHSNGRSEPPTPYGNGSANGNELALSIIGGAAGSSNYVRLFSTTDPELVVASTGKGVKMSASGIAFTTPSTTAAGNDQILSFTLTPSPNAVPYKDGATGMQKAVSLSITAGGRYSLGWVTGAATEKGWVSAINSTGHSGSLGTAITGFNLSLTATTYNLVLFTSDGETKLQGEHLVGNNWGEMGVSVMLQKLFGDEGTTNRLSAEVAQFEVASIPEPSTALLLGGTVVGLLLTKKYFKKTR